MRELRHRSRLLKLGHGSQLAHVLNIGNQFEAVTVTVNAARIHNRDH